MKIGVNFSQSTGDRIGINGHKKMRNFSVPKIHKIWDYFGGTECLLLAQCICAPLQKFLVSIDDVCVISFLSTVKCEMLCQKGGHIRGIPLVFGDIFANIPSNVFSLLTVRNQFDVLICPDCL